MATKKVFFGSLFDFSSTGAEELINEFCATLHETNSAPFITYDKSHKVFSCEVDHGDNIQIPAFVAQFQAYVDFHHSKRSSDFVESPRLRPVTGTTTQDQITEAKLLTANLNPMVDYDEDSDSDDDSSSRGHAITYWIPKNGDVHVLTTEIAEQVANLTGCYLFAEPAEKRVRLVNGDSHLALTKLQQLEPVLSRIAKYRSNADSNVDGNIVATRSDKLGTVIKFARLQQSHVGFDRIMVGPGVHAKLYQSFLSELRILDDGDYIKPRNLDLEPDEVLVSEVEGPSQVFQDVFMPAFGNPSRAQARVSPNPRTSLFSTEQSHAGPNKFLGTNNALRVTEWTKGVDPEANPDVAPPVPLPEHEQPVRRRIVAEDSSDEEDEAQPPQKTSGVEDSLASWPVRISADTPLTIPRSRIEAANISVTTEPNSTQRRIVAANVPISAQARQGRRPFTSKNIFDLLGDDDNGISGEDPDQQSDTEQTDPKPVSHTSNEGSVLIDLASQVHSESISNSKANQKTVRIEGPPLPHDQRHSTPVRTNSQHHGMLPPAPPLSRGMSRGMSPPPRPHIGGCRDTRDNGRKVAQPQYVHGYADIGQKNTLVDTTTSSSAHEVSCPPPGFNYRTNIVRRSSNEAILDSRDDYISTPVIMPSPELSDQTGSGSVLSAEPQGPPRLNPHSATPKPNIKYMQEQAAAKLRIEMQHQKTLRRSQIDGADDADDSDDAGDDDKEEEKEASPQRLEAIDESRSRRLHQVMNQQAGKGTKSVKGKVVGNNTKQETKKDRDERIRKAMSAAYPDPLPSQAAPKPETSSGQMSNKKRALIKSNPDMAVLHPEELRKSALDDQVRRFRTELEPLFEDSRAYPGHLHFELQIGQAFVLRHDRINEHMLYKLKDWNQLFTTTNQSAVSVLFTNLVTTNGLDIDRLLDIQLAEATSDLWDKQGPVSSAVSYEFFCQDKSGAEFTITIDHSADYSLAKSKATLGKVAIHCPGQVWDACAVLCGSREWPDAPPDLVRDVAQFIDDLYIPHKSTKASLYYRLPSTNTFIIRHIAIKRKSLLGCLDPMKLEFLLQLTEVKSLVHSAHPSDKKLFRSHELSYMDMVEKGRLHYEVSIIHKGINEALLENENLEVGELTPVESTGKSLITTAVARQMVELVTHVVEHIDWLGATNIGTLRRLNEENRRHQAMINASLPPQALTQLGPSMPMYTGTVLQTTIGPSGPRTVVPGSAPVGGISTVGLNEPRIVPGVRAGTNADLYQQDGQLFYYGQGGAKVPVIASEVPDLHELNLNVRHEPLQPQDSASQIGNMPRMTRRGLGVGIAGTRGRMPRDDKPVGFW